MKWKRFIVLAFLFYWSIKTFAQKEIHPYSLGVNSAYGFIIPHNPSMLYITKQHIQRQEIYFEKNTYGKKSWEQRYFYPNMGLSLAYFSLNNPHLGNATSLSPYLSFRLNPSNFWMLKLRTALGAGYLSKRFKPEDNFKNTAIGSNINLFFSIALKAEIHLNPELDLIFGANFSHFSNTGFSKPNLGLNMPLIETGLKYNFGKMKEKIEKEEHFEKEKASWQFTSGVGINAIYPPDNVKYLATALSISREKRLNFKSSIGGSLDLYYNPAQRAALRRKDIQINKGWENLQYGLSFYHNIHFGEFSIVTLAGYYLQTKNEELGNFYHLIGGRIPIVEDFKLFFGLKTHFAKAEYFMLGFNYQIK